MWLVNFLAGCFCGAAVTVFLLALIIVGTEDRRHDKR